MLNIRTAIKSNDALLKPVWLNTVAFGLIVAVQQILIFPTLSRFVSVEEFSITILIVTLAAVISNVIGGEASNVGLLRNGVYRASGLAWDSARLVLGGVLLLGVAFVCLAPFVPVHPQDSLGLLILSVLGVARLYCTAPEKALNRFHSVVAVHACYAVGAICGLSFVKSTSFPILPFLCGELAALLCIVIVRWKVKPRICLTLRRTPEFAVTRKVFFDLTLVALVMNVVSYLDRLIIVPLLGAAALSVYYAASSLSKSLSMVTNPAANAILSRLGSVSDQSDRRILARGFKVSMLALIVFTILSLAMSYAGLRVLYPTFFDLALPLLVPVALAAAIGASSDLLRPLVMRFRSSRRFLILNVAYGVTYAVGVAVFSSLWGLLGFAWAGALARAVLFVLLTSQCLNFKRVR